MQSAKKKNSGEILIPFLKWAGGKRWLTKELPAFVPKKFERYVEPFLGSAAIFFHLQPQNSILSDTNKELINSYQVIRDSWKDLVDILEHHHAYHNKEYYYEVRDQSPDSNVEAAARFIYLNRTCWNGLYRVNLKGKFNVPIGTKENVILDSDNFHAMSKALKNSDISVCDFEMTLDKCHEGDFVFIDPPYTVKHNNNGFVKYNEQIFSWADQERLAESARKASARGAHVLISNANHESILNLYSGSRYETLNRRSSISGNPKYRGSYSEVLIRV